jgi:flagellar FliL protein
MASKTATLSPASAGAEAGAAQVPKKSKKKLLVLVLVVVLVVAGAGYFFVLRKHGPPPPPKPGAVVRLDEMTLNLSGGHYLRLGLALQATAKVKQAPDGSKAQDIAINEFSNRSVAELSSNTARNKVKAELQKKVIKAYDGDIMAIYFTEFVMQ